MLQLIFLLVPIAFIILSGLLIYSQGTGLVCAGKLLSTDLKWVLERTPALDRFFYVIMQVLSLIILSSNLVHISNHIVISLDIIYFSSILLLILFQILKDSVITSYETI